MSQRKKADRPARQRTRERISAVTEIGLRVGEKLRIGDTLILKVLRTAGNQASIRVDEVSDRGINMPDGANVTVKERPPRQARAIIISNTRRRLAEKPQRREALDAKRATLPPAKLPLERAARRNPSAATPAMFRLERELAAHADRAYRGKPTNAATRPPGDPADFGADIKLGDAIARYAQDQPLTASAAYARYAGDLAELTLEALAAGGNPLRDAAVYLARAGHVAEAGAMWSELRAADRHIAVHEAKHNRQDESYKGSRRRSNKADPLRKSVKSALEQLVKTKPNLRASEYARLLLRDPYKRRLREAAGRVPSERDLRRKVSQLLPESAKR